MTIANASIICKGVYHVHYDNGDKNNNEKSLQEDRQDSSLLKRKIVFSKPTRLSFIEQEGTKVQAKYFLMTMKRLLNN
jgi:hypothetical protein